MAQLIFAFNNVKLDRNAFKQDTCLTPHEAELCSLVHKVCFNWNRSAHVQLVAMPAFQTLLSLSQFSSEEILSGLKSHEKNCRSTQFAQIKRGNCY